MYQQVLITGSSSGIGYGIAKLLCEKGKTVYGISRSDCDLSEQYTNYKHFNIDLSDFAKLSSNIQQIFKQTQHFDLVILNAGILGEIAYFPEQSVERVKQVMDINVWANKALIDLFIKNIITVKQWVAISSGAAKNGSAGWGAYSVSKAALNMLIQTYAVENPESHFCALAPGLVDTQMQEYISGHKNTEGFVAVSRLQAAKGTADMPNPISVAPILLNAFEEVLQYDSGAFVDVRNLK